MVEINITNTIDQSLIVGMESGDLENYIQEQIAETLTKEMRKHIDEMSFIDMQYSEETESFSISAELVLCSRQDIISNAEIQAQQMSKYGLTAEQIEEVLLIQTNELNGF